MGLSTHCQVRTHRRWPVGATMSNAHVLRFTALGLAAAATLFVGLMQFRPIYSGDEGGADFDGKMWEMGIKSGGFEVEQDWSDCEADEDDADDCDGTGMMQAGGIVLSVG